MAMYFVGMMQNYLKIPILLIATNNTFNYHLGECIIHQLKNTFLKVEKDPLPPENGMEHFVAYMPSYSDHQVMGFASVDTFLLHHWKWILHKNPTYEDHHVFL